MLKIYLKTLYLLAKSTPITLFNAMAMKTRDRNSFSWTVFVLVILAFIGFTMWNFRESGEGFSYQYLYISLSFVTFLAILYFLPNQTGGLICIAGLFLIFTCIGKTITNGIMGYNFGWAHTLIADFSVNLFIDKSLRLSSPIVNFLFSLSAFLVGIAAWFIGLRMAFHREDEKSWVELKRDILRARGKLKDLYREREAQEEEERARQKEVNAQLSRQKQSDRIRAKGGYMSCPNCGATNWNGKRLAIAECSSCKSYFCKTCAGSKMLGKVQLCPKCGSDSFKQKGFVEPG